MTVANRPDYQQRVIDEREQLAERLVSLERFVASQKFMELHRCDRFLLSAQLGAMKQYEQLLQERIWRFE
ncbi:crAss001_48 related protein [Burkholderia ubonensis]|uniref:crAss001_48 related protein n=1 Tax=Burkholderia ubonensis TaxID=101571 RepID=UPI000BA5FC66|nr:hypothetical protein [Burkholderia ubonensis]PAJ94418.1 hypothetical protein CJO69_11115 [Burkholderia ubonensis]RQP69496.1 hypothetical protein DF013_26145 [Burkholderia ubonensis]RQR54894.1 hypothetical protein DIE19_24835 [Burkholderia sp. Bp9126]